MIRPDQLTHLQQVFLRHGVILAYLFGSQAEGAARPDSDVDIAVLLPHDRFRQMKADEYFGLVSEVYDALERDDVDMAYLNEASPLLAFEVVRHGVVLHEDPELLPAVDYAARAISRYADTASFRRLTRQYLAERVRARRPRSGAPAQEAGND